MSLIVQPTAIDELSELLSHIRSRDPHAADKVERGLQKTFATMNSFPFIGTRYPSQNPRLRDVRYKLVTGYPQFVVVYRTDGTDVVIMHILRGKRNIAAILGDD